MSLKIIGFSGSLRAASYNTVAGKLALNMAQQLGAETEWLNLKELNIPLFDEDVEQAGLLNGVKIFRDKIMAAQALIIASPEYNHSLTGVLKNALDWASRSPNVLAGKVAAILGASNGGFGSVRSQLALRPILSYLNVLVVPSPEVHLSNAPQIFTADGQLTDAKLTAQINDLVTKLITMTTKLTD